MRPIRRFVTWLATPGGIGALFVAGLLIRLALAGMQGFPYDMSSFQGWADRLAERGPWNFYPQGGEQYFVDYPPGYLYVLWVLGLAADLIVGGPPPAFWIKVPPILADLALAWLVMTAARRLAPASEARRHAVRPMAAAAILLNPAIIFVSAVWGQADSVPAVLVVGAFLLLGTGAYSLRREAAGIALLAIAIGTKPQVGFVLPVVGLVLLWRHVRMRADAADDPHGRKQALWLGTFRVVVLGLAGVAAGFLLFLPFKLYPSRALEFYATSAGQYEVTSVFAFNFWGAVGFWRPDSGPDAVEFLGLPAALWGLVLFVVCAAFVLARAYASLRSGTDQGRVLVFGSMALTIVGFAVVTRIHERYLFLPLALGAALIGVTWLRRAFIGLSLAYFVNVLFPYVYYLRQENLPAPARGGLFDAFYGTDIGGARIRLMCIAITAVCAVIAWRGWRALEKVPDVSHVDTMPGAVEDEVVEPAPPWSLALHPVGRTGALIALGVFAVALLSRFAGLGHPPGMYFDEVYHARAGAEYLANKEIYEYTHPPFAKEVMGFSIQHLAGFKTLDGVPLPRGATPQLLSPRPNGVLWATGGATARVVGGAVSDDCDITAQRTVASADIRPTAVSATTTAVLLGGVSDDGPVLIRFEGSTETWRATLPEQPVAVAMVEERAYVVTAGGSLVSVSPDGEPKTLAIGASDLSASVATGAVWAMFPDDRRIAAYDAAGERTDVIEVDGQPHAIAAPEDTDRVFAAVGDEILSYDAETQSVHARIAGAADLLGTVPETTAVWAVNGTSGRVFEPHSGSEIGRVSFERPPTRLIGEPLHHQLLAVSDGRLECATGRPQFAWRFGSAIAGAAMVLFVFLLAMRLTGNLAVGLLGALFLAVDGLAFTISRIAMNDSYSTAFMLGAWFCALSALRAWGRTTDDARSAAASGIGRTTDDARSAAASGIGRTTGDAREPRDRVAAICWLFATGVFGGLGLASKWPALYALAAIGLLMFWDGLDRKERSIWRVAGHFVPSAAVVGGTLVVLPLAIYVLTYTPYFGLGHSIGDLFRLQESMLSYHAGLTASHPFGSPWYGWPFGYRSVYLYLASWGAERSEIWSIPNLVVIVGGLVALIAAAYRAFAKRSGALAVLVAAALVQYLPWVAVTRVTFMYHYLPVVPFLAIALGWVLVIGLRDNPYRRAITIGTCAAAVLFFLLLYPMLVGWQVPNSYGDAVRAVIPWVI